MKDKDDHNKPALTANSNVHRFTKALPPRHEPDEAEALESFQEARSQSREALMLDIRLTSGRIVSLPYSSLELADYLPDGRLLLDFGKRLVTAEGRNMLRVRELISEHRARFIQEGTDIERGLRDEDAVHIEHIEITEVEEL
jgi:hypothetical protein